MKITNNDGRIHIYTPYNPTFVKKANLAGAKWDSVHKYWEADARNIDTIRKIMRDVYGRDDRPAKLVNVKVVTNGSIYVDRGPVTMFGRIIASASGRDSGARIGEGIAFESGGAKSGGSVKNWETKINGTFTIFDVPEAAVAEKLDWDDDLATFEIMQSVIIDQAALETEKQALLTRLAEIDAALQTGKSATRQDDPTCTE